MNTQSHAIINVALLSRKATPLPPPLRAHRCRVAGRADVYLFCGRGTHSQDIRKA